MNDGIVGGFDRVRCYDICVGGRRAAGMERYKQFDFAGGSGARRRDSVALCLPGLGPSAKHLSLPQATRRHYGHL